MPLKVQNNILDCTVLDILKTTKNTQRLFEREPNERALQLCDLHTHTY